MPIRLRYWRRSAAFLLALAGSIGGVLSRAPSALAQPAAARSSTPPKNGVTGVVLDLQGDEIVLDIGSNSGLSSGDKVELWRPLKLKHPVTGKIFTDRFLIGSLELGQVRPTMSLATVVGALSRAPQKGDVVIRASAASNPPAASPQAPSAAPEPQEAPVSSATQASPEDKEAAALGRIMDALQGADLAARIRAYEEYVRMQPKGRFARVLYEEAASLRRVRDLERRTAAEPKAGAPRTEVELKSFHRSAEAVGRAPLRLSVELSDEATGAILHVRSPGQPAFASFLMEPAGLGYFGATIPAERMVGSELQYFIEATNERGIATPVVAGPGAPATIELQQPPELAKPKKLEAKMVLLTDYADYNRLRGNDYVWQTEGYLQVRYRDIGVRALRMGFGVYRGYGGSVEELDRDMLSPRRVGLTYGYTELEMGVHELFAVIGRTVVGLDEDGVAGGGQVLLRIGNDKQTNLIVGGELLGGVGLRGITQLELSTFKRFPILLRLEVTNQPAGARVSHEQIGLPGVSQGGGQVGGRGIAQLGWTGWDPFVVSVRGSFQGRTINHAGPGVGAAVSYQW